jgi:arylsulfatase
MGDNGASAEGTLQGTTNEVATAANGETEDIPYLLSMIDELGGPKTYNHYPVGWCHAMDTLMQWTKQVASHFGGTRNGLVISWPKRIKARGEVRSQFHHIIDVVPTIYEACGITAPTSIDGVEQKPLEGVSMVYTFDDARAKDRHTTQYFEMMGNRGIYHDGGWPAPRRCGCRGSRRGRTPARTTSSGSCTTWRRTSPRPTTSPARIRRS